MTDQGTTAQAKEKAHEVAEQAQEQAKQVAGQARDQLRGQIDERSTQAGEKVSSQAEDLRSVSEQLRQQGKDQPAKLADQAAERLERAGGWLASSDADAIIGDVEDFARRNPMAVLAGGLALGFVASRMLKASSTDRYQGRSLANGGRTIPVRTGEQRFSRPEPATPPPLPSAGAEVPVGLDPALPPRPTGPGTL